MKRWLGAVIAAASAVGCPDLDGGGGEGGGTVNFTQGFVFVRKDDRNVYVADRSDFNKVGKLTETGGTRHPSLSRDGKRAVYVQTTAVATALMVVATSGGAKPSKVFGSSAEVKNLRGPVFSPDGAKIAFAYDAGAASSVGVVNTDGSSFSRLAGTAALSYGAPSFYPDGKSVLAPAGNSSSSFNQLEKLNLETGMATSVTNTLGNEAMQISNRAVVSPDGSKAAFDARISTGAVRIFVIQLSTKQVTQLTDYTGDPHAIDGFPSWVGVDKVGFSSDTGGNDAVYALPATSTRTSGGFQLASGIEPWYGPVL